LIDSSRGSWDLDSSRAVCGAPVWPHRCRTAVCGTNDHMFGTRPTIRRTRASNAGESGRSRRPFPKSTHHHVPHAARLVAGNRARRTLVRAGRRSGGAGRATALHRSPGERQAADRWRSGPPGRGCGAASGGGDGQRPGALPLHRGDRRGVQRHHPPGGGSGGARHGQRFGTARLPVDRRRAARRLPGERAGHRHPGGGWRARPQRVPRPAADPGLSRQSAPPGARCTSGGERTGRAPVDRHGRRLGRADRGGRAPGARRAAAPSTARRRTPAGCPSRASRW
jgi:hypothetical protein